MTAQSWAERRADPRCQRAMALLDQQEVAEPLAHVWCGGPGPGHRLGAIYRLPDLGDVLVLRESKMRAKEYSVNPRDPIATVTLLPWLFLLSEDAATLARCRCGTWHVDVHTTRAEFDGGSTRIPSSCTYDAPRS